SGRFRYQASCRATNGLLISFSAKPDLMRSHRSRYLGGGGGSSSSPIGSVLGCALPSRGGSGLTASVACGAACAAGAGGGVSAAGAGSGVTSRGFTMVEAVNGQPAAHADDASSRSAIATNGDFSVIGVCSRAGFDASPQIFFASSTYSTKSACI